VRVPLVGGAILARDLFPLGGVEPGEKSVGLHRRMHAREVDPVRQRQRLAVDFRSADHQDLGGGTRHAQRVLEAGHHLRALDDETRLSRQHDASPSR